MNVLNEDSQVSIIVVCEHVSDADVMERVLERKPGYTHRVACAECRAKSLAYVTYSERLLFSFAAGAKIQQACDTDAALPVCPVCDGTHLVRCPICWGEHYFDDKNGKPEVHLHSCNEQWQCDKARPQQRPCPACTGQVNEKLASACDKQRYEEGWGEAERPDVGDAYWNRLKAAYQTGKAETK